MDVTGLDLCFQPVSAQLGLSERLRRRDADELSVVAELKAGEGENFVGRCAEAVVGFARAEEPVGCKRELDELGDGVAGAVAGLDALERVP